MLQHPIIQEVARYQQAERLATAERRHRLFRTPLAAVMSDTGGTVIPMPVITPNRSEQSAHVA